MTEASHVREVLRRRLAVQRLTGCSDLAAADVVRLLTCVQSQEYAHAFWSLGMRTAGLDYAGVQREFDQGRFVRTHILRPTWHYVAAEDLRWILGVTSPRVQQINRSRYRQLGLDQHDLDRGAELLLAALRGGRHLTRRELGVALTDGGLSSEGQRLAYLVMNAELEALICSGPMRGAQHTYAVVEERVAPAPAGSAERSLAELTWRFFAGHGPASLKDFTRWSSVTVADATAGLELVRHRLERVEVAGQALLCDPAAGDRDHGDERDPDQEQALLLPLYDEVTLSYPQLNFPLASGHPHRPGTDLFVGSVVVDAANVGLWRRTVRGQKVLIETDLAPGLSSEKRRAVARAGQRLAWFLGKEQEVRDGPEVTDRVT